MAIHTESAVFSNSYISCSGLATSNSALVIDYFINEMFDAFSEIGLYGVRASGNYADISSALDININFNETTSIKSITGYFNASVKGSVKIYKYKEGIYTNIYSGIPTGNITILVNDDVTGFKINATANGNPLNNTANITIQDINFNPRDTLVIIGNTIQYPVDTCYFITPSFAVGQRTGITMYPLVETSDPLASELLVESYDGTKAVRLSNE